MKKMQVEITYIEELLGTASADPEIHKTFIASKAPDAATREEEVAALGVDAVEEKSTTVFPRDDDGNPFTWDYQWKGFFKDSCGMLRRVKGTHSKKLTAYKKVIDGLVMVAPRKVALELPEGEEVGMCQRPLRASTAQGERVALASSETAPRGTVQRFTVLLLDEGLVDAVIEWLDYGYMHGTGQWRNSGKGRFVYRAEIDGEEVGNDTELAEGYLAEA